MLVGLCSPLAAGFLVGRAPAPRMQVSEEDAKAEWLAKNTGNVIPTGRALDEDKAKATIAEAKTKANQGHKIKQGFEASSLPIIN